MAVTLQLQVASAVVLSVVLAAATLWLVLKKSKKTFLSPEHKKQVRLISKESLSHDVRKFRFTTAPGLTLGLEAGRHIILSTTKDGKTLARNYSPVTPESTEGYFELCVKVYFPNEKFPQGGQMSQLLESLSLGDFVDVKGPVGKCYYSAPSQLTLLRGDEVQTRQAPSIAMIAGGTGITPFLAIIRKIFANPADHTKVSLLFANQTEDDIFLRKELEMLAEKHSNFKLWYTLDRPPKNWSYSQGFITDEMIRGHLWDGAASPPVFLICGPLPMVKFACLPNLEKLGVKESDIITW
jgi:cytochrome-b5 reductase